MSDRAGEDLSREVRDAVNELLHRAFDCAPCEVACTHVVTGTWTALGVANVVGRRAEQEAHPIYVHIEDRPDDRFGAGLAAGFEEGRRRGRR